MKISLIGSNGFLSNSIGIFCNKEAIKLDVWGLDEPAGYSCDQYHQIDLLSQEIVYGMLSDSDLIIYAAGLGVQSSNTDPYESIYSINTFLPIKLFKELSKLQFKGTLITFGSYFEYGNSSQDKYLSELDIINSTNPAPNDYCISKRLLTRFITSYGTELKYWHFILPTIYGESENPNRLLPYVINAIQSNSEIRLTSGEQVRQYLYVDDIMAVLLSSLEKKLSSGIYNIAGNEEFSVKNLVNYILESFGKPLNADIFGKAAKSDTNMKVLKLDGSKLLNSINIIPTTKIIDVFRKY